MAALMAKIRGAQRRPPMGGGPPPNPAMLMGHDSTPGFVQQPTPPGWDPAAHARPSTTPDPTANTYDIENQMISNWTGRPYTPTGTSITSSNFGGGVHGGAGATQPPPSGSNTVTFTGVPSTQTSAISPPSASRAPEAGSWGQFGYEKPLGTDSPYMFQRGPMSPLGM